MEVKSFYCCYSTGDNVESASPVVFDRDTAINVAMQVLREPGDFIGFIDPDDKVLQFYYQEDGQIWVEHPSPEHNGSFGKPIPLDDLEPLLINLPQQFDKTCITGLAFCSW